MAVDLGRRPSLKDLIDLGVPTAALLAAHRHGLLGATLERSATPDEFARELNLDVVATRLTLNVLATCGVLVHHDSRYAASPELVAWERDAPGGVMVHLRLLEHLPELLVTGKPLIAMDGTLRERASHFTTVASGLGNMYAAAAGELAQAMALEGGAILDLGAGSGVWSLAMAARWPDARVTAVDLPEVIEAVRRNAVALNVGSRVATVAGSYFDIDFPDAAYAVVILGNLLHLETAENAALLVRKAAAALRPDGTFVVIDILGNTASEEYERDPAHAMYALFLASRTSQGRMHSRAQVLGWLESSGLGQVRPLNLPSAPPQLDCLLARGVARPKQ